MVAILPILNATYVYTAVCRIWTFVNSSVPVYLGMLLLGVHMLVQFKNSGFSGYYSDFTTSCSIDLITCSKFNISGTISSETRQFATLLN